MSIDRRESDPNEDQRDPQWSENQAFMVEQMQPQRSGEMPTPLDTILLLRQELERTRERLGVLVRMEAEVSTRVLPALARIHDGKPCPADHHSPYWRCPECDLRAFLARWREDQRETEVRDVR